jgi:DNA repair exonuclease SbcCD ATPase subunit
LTIHQENYNDTVEKIKNYKIVLALLKDAGIKTKIIKTYLPVVNSLINKYLKILNFPGLFSFDINFEASIKVRGNDNATYYSFSEGEKMRLNLALIFAFRELSILKNATHCNIIIFDEVADSSLDGVQLKMRINKMYLLFLTKKMMIYYLNLIKILSFSRKVETGQIS